MSKSNVVGIQSSILIDLIDNASRYAYQARAVVVCLTANDAYKSLSKELKANALWAVTDRLSDIEKLIRSHDKKEHTQFEDEVTRFTAQTKAVIYSLTDNIENLECINQEIIADVLWFISDRLEDVGNVIKQMR